MVKICQDIERQASIVSVGRPVILKDMGPPLVLLSLPEYKHYRWLMSQQGYISAIDARRAAYHAFLQDLVGCPVGGSHPEWVKGPAPHWAVPFIDFPASSSPGIVLEEEEAYLAFS